MVNNRTLSPWILALALAGSSLAWVNISVADTQTKPQANTTQQAKLMRTPVDTSDWLKLQEVVKKLEKDGHKEILSVTQTGRGYFARVIDKDGHRLHLLIDPTTGESTPQDIRALKRHRHAEQGHPNHWQHQKGHLRDNRQGRGYYHDKKGMHPQGPRGGQ